MTKEQWNAHVKLLYLMACSGTADAENTAKLFVSMIDDDGKTTELVPDWLQAIAEGEV